jgi:sugar phosphate isomerase/epimerase
MDRARLARGKAEDPPGAIEAKVVAERPLGTMVTYGYPAIEFDDELDLAMRFGATVLEILPDWGRLPDPELARKRAADRGLTIHSAHGCWGGRTICARRVDLGATDVAVHRESVDDLKACVDWLAETAGRCLVVHPGGLSDPHDRDARRCALVRGLAELAEHARGTGVIICVENMPPGVYPGSGMADLATILSELNDAALALALDTGHANITASPALETLAAGPLLKTTHVHDNNGRQDSHEPPGHGTIDWRQWGLALDAVGYSGPIMLECIRHLRADPSSFMPDVVARLLRRVDPGPSGPDRL